MTQKECKTIFENFAAQFPQLINTTTIEKQTESEKIVTKKEMAEYIVNFLDLRPIESENKKRYYFDTAYHEHGEAVEKLAALHIINNENFNFNIDTPASRADLAVMLGNTFSRFNNFDLELINTDTNEIIDLKGASYEKEVLYSYQLKLLDYLLESKREQTLFFPQKALTKHEAYYIIQKASGEEFEYDNYTADQKTISRGELAELFIAAFDYNKPHQYKKTITITDKEGNDLNQTISLISKLKSILSINNI